MEGDGDAVANAASASAIVRFTAGPLHVSTSAPEKVLAVDDPVFAHYGHGLVGKTVVRKAKELVEGRRQGRASGVVAPRHVRHPLRRLRYVRDGRSRLKCPSPQCRRPRPRPPINKLPGRSRWCRAGADECPRAFGGILHHL